MSDDWKRGLRMVAPGIYEDASGAQHMDGEEFVWSTRSWASAMIPADEYLEIGLKLARRTAADLGAEFHESGKQGERGKEPTGSVPPPAE